mgnify:FL=1|jgi:ribose 5-phosphate isomerase B
MKIALGADHAGYELKEKLKEFLSSQGYEIEDFGAYALDPNDDYTDFVFPVAHAVAHGEVGMGVVFGKSGQGEAIAANRVLGVRAALYAGGNEDIIRLSREHNDANVLSLGADYVNESSMKDIVTLWLSTPFSGDERHIRRIKKLDS